VSKRVITARLVDVRKSIHIVDTISFSVVAGSMKREMTKINGARGT